MFLLTGIILGFFLGVTESSESLEASSNGIVPQKCLHCICMVESQCKAIGCRMDVGSLSCGYYQIKLPYWTDCGKLKPSSGCSGDTDCWKKCSNDLTCASKCVNAYMARYGRQPGCKADCESYARLHNGGPGGCKNPGTLGYWNKVKKCLGEPVETKLLFIEFLKTYRSNKL